MRPAAVIGIALSSCLVVPALAASTGTPTISASLVLPNGRALTPAGTMVAAGDFPVGGVLTPDGRLLAATTGSQPNAVLDVDPSTLALTQTTPNGNPTGTTSTSAAPWAMNGHLAVAKDGTVYASAGRLGTVDVFTRTGPALHQTGTLSAGGYAAGIALTPDGSGLLVTHPFDSAHRYDKGTTVSRINLATGTRTEGTVGSTPYDVTAGRTDAGPLAVVANRDDSSVSLLDPTTLAVQRTVVTGRQPAAPTVTPAGTVLVLDSLDDDLVEVDPRTGAVLHRVDLRGSAPLGAAPSALAVSADGSTAYVALSGDNAVAVLGRGGGGWSVRGRIPTADYPTSVVVDPAHHQLLVTSGKGTLQQETYPVGAPVVSAPLLAPGSSGLGVSGVVEAIPMPDASQLAAYTRQVAANNRTVLRDGDSADSSRRDSGSGGDRQDGRRSRDGGSRHNVFGISHVVYVIRENKTYDEEFGDLPGGSPALVMYPQAVTPNAHALAQSGPLLTNYYADEEVSDTGHQAVMGGVANDWVQRLSQQAYGLDGTPRQGAELGNGSDVLWSPGNYLLDSALASSISCRDYGEFYRHSQQADGPAVTPALDAHIDHGFPGFGFSPDVPDTRRIAYWQRQFAQQQASDTFPALTVLYLPEDHTTTGLSSTPQAQVADADLALGRLVQTLSHSPYWNSTLMVMTEDDPQSGLDHVDQHRSLALLAGGRVRQGTQVTAHLDQSALLATIEQLLGLPTLTEFDATAPTVTNLLQSSSSAPPFTALQPVVPAVPAGSLATLRARARAAVRAQPGGLAQLPARTQLELQWLATRGGTPPV